jgi:hypothetical protein
MDMTPAEALLADLRSRGIELETDGTRLRWRPSFLVTGPLAERIHSERTGLERLEIMSENPAKLGIFVISSERS